MVDGENRAPACCRQQTSLLSLLASMLDQIIKVDVVAYVVVLCIILILIRNSLKKNIQFWVIIFFGTFSQETSTGVSYWKLNISCIYFSKHHTEQWVKRQKQKSSHFSILNSRCTFLLELVQVLVFKDKCYVNGYAWVANSGKKRDKERRGRKTQRAKRKQEEKNES